MDGLMERWMDDRWLLINIYLTIHKAEQENVNKATPAGEGMDMALGSWKLKVFILVTLYFLYSA